MIETEQQAREPRVRPDETEIPAEELEEVAGGSARAESMPSNQVRN